MPVNLPPLVVVSEEDYAADEAAAAAAGVDLQMLRKPRVISYDTTRFPFREAVLMCLEMSSSGGDDDRVALESLRAPEPNSDPHNRKCKRTGNRGPSTHYIQAWQSGVRGPSRRGAAFDALYLDFLREVVVPLVGDPRGIVFQRKPTFRCHVAGGGTPTGKLHNDTQCKQYINANLASFQPGRDPCCCIPLPSRYCPVTRLHAASHESLHSPASTRTSDGHARTEINLWLPITKATASKCVAVCFDLATSAYQPS